MSPPAVSARARRTDERRFRPRDVRSIELAEPLIGVGDRAALALVRLHTWPLGLVELDPGEGREQVLVRIWAQLRDSIAAHLESDGLDVPAAGADLDGLSAVATGLASLPRCLAERRAFLATAPRVSVVVPVADRPDLLEGCLGDLLAQEYPAAEILVVDNAPSRSGARVIVEAALRRPVRPSIRYLVEPRPGSSVARNRGLNASTTDITAFVDADVRIDEHWLTELVRPLATDPETAASAGLILPLSLETEAQAWMMEWGGYDKGFRPRTFDLVDHRDAGPLYPYQPGLFGSGQSMAFRTSILRGLGGFDRALGVRTVSQGGEDLAVLLDAVLAGHRLAYAPGAIVWHPDPPTGEGFLRKIESYAVGLTALVARTAMTHPGSGAEIARRVPAAVGYFLRPGSGRNRRRSARFPTLPVLARELGGMAWGPFAYGLSRLELRRARRREARGLERGAGRDARGATGANG